MFAVRLCRSISLKRDSNRIIVSRRWLSVSGVVLSNSTILKFICSRWSLETIRVIDFQPWIIYLWRVEMVKIMSSIMHLQQDLYINFSRCIYSAEVLYLKQVLCGWGRSHRFDPKFDSTLYGNHFLQQSLFYIQNKSHVSKKMLYIHGSKSHISQSSFIYLK